MTFDNIPSDTRLEEPIQATVRVNNGSGVICQITGHSPIIITAYHVVKGDNQVVVRSASISGVIIGDVVSHDEDKDIAIVSFSHQIEKLKTITCLSESEKVHIGDQLWVLGYPIGWINDIPLITQATLAGVGSEVWISSDCSWGNSGGPVLKESMGEYKLAGVIIGNVDVIHEDLRRIQRTFKIIEDDIERSTIARTMATMARLISEMIATHFRTGFIKIASLSDIISLLK